MKKVHSDSRTSSNAFSKKGHEVVSKLTKSKWFYASLFVVTTVLLFVPLLFKDQLIHLRSLGLLGLFLINFIGSATILFPAPVILSVGIAGNLYNPLLVALAASIGSTLGEGTGFLLGFSSKEVINLKKHKFFYIVVSILFKKYGALIIVLFSLIPNPIMDGVGIFAGMSGYSWKKFLLWVFVGRLLRNIVIANLGSLF